MTTIESVLPVEDVGRETISRFDMQFQAAAYAALEILEGKGVVCVYCDYHDDFVVQRNVGGKITYHFFQVKTKKKENHQWDLNGIFALPKTKIKADPERIAKIRSSFAGKLLLHGIIFSDNCTEVTLLSNVYFDDDVVNTVEELRGKSPKSKAATFLSDNFSVIFSLEEPHEVEPAEVLSKMSLQPAVRHIGQDREAFTSAARSAIYQYSEIDLKYHETEELANGLVELVYKKSRTSLADVTPEEIQRFTGVQLEDLLEVLCISRAAYQALIAGADPNALKTASVIQRWYQKAGATTSMIDYAAQQKVNWDIWLRTARHIYVALDLEILLQGIDNLFDTWQKAGAGFDQLSGLIDAFSQKAAVKNFIDLDKDLLFGAMNAVLVRKYSQ